MTCVQSNSDWRISIDTQLQPFYQTDRESETPPIAPDPDARRLDRSALDRPAIGGLDQHVGFLRPN